MTITSNILRKDYTANGVNTTFAFDFPIFYESNATPKFSLEVIIADTLGVEATKIETTDYTITYNQTDYLNGVIAQGNVVLNTTPTLNYKVSILRKLNFTQNNDITTSGSDALPGTALEGSLDKLTLMLLETKENLNRVVKLPKSSILTNIEFPIGVSQANQVIAINNDGNNLTTKDLADVGLAPVSTFAKTLLDDLTAAQARTTLDAQQLNANLTALAGLTGALNKLPYFNGLGSMTLRDLFATSTAQGINYLSNPTNLPSITINSGAPNTTLDISAGVINHDDGSAQFVVSAMSKIIQSTGSWTAGTGQNGLDTGARANSTWYQVFIIRKTSDGTSDILFSTSRTSPTIPIGYTLVAWLGAMRTNSSGNIDAKHFAKRTSFGQITQILTGEVATGATTVLLDDTIPQNNKGNQYMELQIIPLSSTSRLEIDVVAHLNNNSGSYTMIGFLCRDAIANAIATSNYVGANSGYEGFLSFRHSEISGSSSATTYKFRAGSTAGTNTFNGDSGTRQFGGTYASSITIKEYI